MKIEVRVTLTEGHQRRYTEALLRAIKRRGET